RRQPLDRPRGPYPAQRGRASAGARARTARGPDRAEARSRRMSLESANPNLFDENASPVPDHVGRSAWRIGVVLLWLLIALQLAWYLVLLPPARVSPWLPLAFLGLPLLI